MDRHRIDADADPDPDLHQNYADPHADPAPSVTHVGKCYFFLLLVTALQVYNVLRVSSVSNFKYLRQLIEILWKKYTVVYKYFHMPGIDTDPDRPDPDPPH